jgi:hypothetical protein
VIRIDPQTNEVVASIPLYQPWALAFGHGALWVAAGAVHGRLDRIDPRTHAVVASIRLCRGGSKTCGYDFGLLVTPQAVWVGSGFVYQVDPTTRRVTAIMNFHRAAGTWARETAFAVGDGVLWLALSDFVESGIWGDGTWRTAVTRWRIP